MKEMELHLIVQNQKQSFNETVMSRKINKMGKEGWAATLHVEASST